MENNFLKVNKVEQTPNAIYRGCKPLNLTESQIAELSERWGLNNPKEPTPQEQIKTLEAKIAATDYQVIKCYEYSLAGLELPYDITLLHEEREAIREQIRALEDSEI
jgi:hypothetical protein